MDGGKLRLVKIDYYMSVEELDYLLDKVMGQDDRKWIANLSTVYPNLSVIDEKDLTSDIILLDFNTLDKIDYMLTQFEVNYRITDVSEVFYKEPKTFNKSFIASVDEYIKKNIDLDSVLDRIKEVGLDNITVFEKKFLDMSYGDS